MYQMFSKQPNFSVESDKSGTCIYFGVVGDQYVPYIYLGVWGQVTTLELGKKFDMQVYQFGTSKFLEVRS